MKQVNLISWFSSRRLLRPANRKYKDRLFQYVFKEKKDLLSLYNAVNGTNYTNENELEITTLEDVLFISMKNDKSFIISSTMNLYEHQSTVNLNMPIRGVLYFAKLYGNYIKENELDIYGKKLVKLPNPQYIVFYNGDDEIPDDDILFLSSAFSCESNSLSMEPALECKARILNVNYGHNKELLGRCTKLLHYSQFVATIKANINSGMSLEHAIDSAIAYCVDNGILADILSKYRNEVIQMLLTEFDEKRFAKTMHDEGFEEGHNAGFDEAIRMFSAFQAGNTTIDQLTALGFDENQAAKALESFRK